MYIKESSILRDAIKQYQYHQQQNFSQTIANSTSTANSISQQQQSSQINSQIMNRNINLGSNIISNNIELKSTTSPQNDPPPPSPASSVGSTNSIANVVSSGLQNGQEQSQNLPTSNSALNSSSNIIPNNKLASLYEKFFKITESNVKSQMIWDSNETQINEISYLKGINQLFIFQQKSIKKCTCAHVSFNFKRSFCSVCFFHYVDPSYLIKLELTN